VSELQLMFLSWYCFTAKLLGPIVDFDNGLMKSSQYALFKIFYQRMLVDPKRTWNPKEADLFFIP
jgi:hypothetical protein